MKRVYAVKSSRKGTRHLIEHAKRTKLSESFEALPNHNAFMRSLKYDCDVTRGYAWAHIVAYYNELC